MIGGRRMPAMIMTVTMDGVECERTFIVRMFEHAADVGKEVPVDIWEVSAIFADQDTVDYLNDERTLERLMR